MTKLQEVERLISQMTDAEKAQLFEHIAHDMNNPSDRDFPGTERTPSVLGGEARIVRTRIRSLGSGTSAAAGIDG